MGCCSSTYAEPKEGPQKGLENGNADGRAKGKESNQTSMANGKVHHDKRRDSIDSVYFDAEEDFIAEVCLLEHFYYFGLFLLHSSFSVFFFFPLLLLLL